MMVFFSKLSCFSIFALYITVSSVIGETSKPEPCITYGKSFMKDPSKPCVVNKTQYVLHGKTMKLPCVYEPVTKARPGWYRNGRRIGGTRGSRFMDYEDGERLTIKNVDYEDNGVYTCLVYYPNNFDYLYSVKLVVQSLPFFNYIAPEKINVVEGRTAILKCEADGEPKPTIKWLKNGRELNDRQYKILNSGDLQITDSWFENVGKYTCIASNLYGSVQATTHLTLKQPTKITDFPKNLELNSGDTATFTCKAVADSDLKLRIHWQKNGKMIDVESEPRISLSPDSSLITIIRVEESDAGTYTCVASTDLDETSAPAILVVR